MLGSKSRVFTSLLTTLILANCAASLSHEDGEFFMTEYEAMEQKPCARHLSTSWAICTYNGELQDAETLYVSVTTNDTSLKELVVGKMSPQVRSQDPSSIDTLERKMHLQFKRHGSMIISPMSHVTFENNATYFAALKLLNDTHEELKLDAAKVTWDRRYGDEWKSWAYWNILLLPPSGLCLMLLLVTCLKARFWMAEHAAGASSLTSTMPCDCSSFGSQCCSDTKALSWTVLSVIGGLALAVYGLLMGLNMLDDMRNTGNMDLCTYNERCHAVFGDFEWPVQTLSNAPYVIVGAMMLMNFSVIRATLLKRLQSFRDTNKGEFNALKDSVLPANNYDQFEVSAGYVYFFCVSPLLILNALATADDQSEKEGAVAKDQRSSSYIIRAFLYAWTIFVCLTLCMMAKETREYIEKHCLWMSTALRKLNGFTKCTEYVAERTTRVMAKRWQNAQKAGSDDDHAPLRILDKLMPMSYHGTACVILIIIGLNSAIYHICPSPQAFQFDSSFLLVFLLLMALSAFTSRPTRFHRPNTFGCKKNPLCSVRAIGLFLMPVWSAYIIFGMVKHDTSVVLTLVGLIALPAVFWRLLCVDMVDVFCSARDKSKIEIQWTYKSMTKCVEKTCFAVLLVLYAATFMFFAFIFYQTTDKLASPAESRDSNAECIIAFLDIHSLWHLVSALNPGIKLAIDMMVNLRLDPTRTCMKKENATGNNELVGDELMKLNKSANEDRQQAMLVFHY